MCGRYTLVKWAENARFKAFISEFEREYGGKERVILPESGDLRPGDTAPIILTISSKMTCEKMRWGFDYDGKKIINARSETAHIKPAFKNSVLSMRCLVPATGYYEWNTHKEKFLFRDPNGDMLYLAGLYRYGDDGQREFVILTREAYGEYAQVHDRMPLIIRDKAAWLRDPAQAQRLLTEWEDIKLEMVCLSPQQLSMF